MKLCQTQLCSNTSNTFAFKSYLDCQESRIHCVTPTMTNARSRLASLVAQFLPAPSSPGPAQYQDHNYNFHSLSPTLFLPRAAAIEPNVRFYAYMISDFTEKYTGGGYISSHGKRQNLATFISRSCGSRQGASILHSKEGLQKGWNTLSKYSCILGVNFWNSCGRSCQRRYASQTSAQQEPWLEEVCINRCQLPVEA